MENSKIDVSYFFLTFSIQSGNIPFTQSILPLIQWLCLVFRFKLFLLPDCVFLDQQDDRHGNGAIYYMRSADAGLSWGEEIRLTDEIADAWMPCIAASDTGVHVVWNDYRDGLGTEIYYKHSKDKGITWDLDTRLTNSPGEAFFPSITADGDMVHVTWFDNRLLTEEIFYNHSCDCGDCWNTDDSCLTNGDGFSSNPSIVAAGSAVHVVWTDYSDGNEDIYYKRNPTGNIAVGVDGMIAASYQQSFSVFPNPASSSIHIRLNEKPTNESEVTIRNIFGETMITRPSWNDEVNVDVSNLQNGLYLVEISTPGWQSACRKLVIRK